MTKWMNYGLSAIYLLLVFAFIGLEVVPAEQWEKIWTKERVELIETAIIWSTALLGALLAVFIIIGQQTNRSRASADWTEALEDKSAGRNGIKLANGHAQHIGAREEQQDAFCFSAVDDSEAIDRYGVLAVLADGMGGFAMGREASRLAVQTQLLEYTAKSAEEPVPAALERALHQANKEVYELAKRHELEWSVGTTLIAAVIRQDQLYWISAGDSRIYLYRGGVLIPLTRDHVYANRLYERVKAGELTMEEAESHPERHLLTSYLGIPQLVEIDANQTPFRLHPGDWILLCSDGLYDELSEPLLEEAVHLSPQHAAEYIMRHVLALQKRYQDNATIMIFACT
ncbi:protein phosphatase 2C domain-containing protein [Paenibacillus alkaliterrae]|uniref:PP2C family protein-serine/threonine phosphatase n=1 Tax=Paenibacillus alkaliterrae TaxID=320909 RepID=UPI001F304773|nr:protein phosphatase 2C domain-containing protein [Paenibacillus alkaliterrae]MCF2938171.1 protein phosphatase 2C domain-containing protein [Paenibacillus alkaliterrae]